MCLNEDAKLAIIRFVDPKIALTKFKYFLTNE